MPRRITHREPVVVFHPVHRQAVACFRGKEIEDSDPLATHPDFEWLFTETAAPGVAYSVPIDFGVESATAAPGQKRTTRR